MINSLCELGGTTVGTLVDGGSTISRSGRRLRRLPSGLENRSTREGTQGSNPCLSALSRYIKH